MTTTAHQLLDHLLDDLKKELCAKMQQDIALELEKKERDLQNMVADMLAEHREEMVELLMNKDPSSISIVLTSTSQHHVDC